jgi:hypothetical protein
MYDPALEQTEDVVGRNWVQIKWLLLKRVNKSQHSKQDIQEDSR